MTCQSGRYADNRQAKQRNEVPSYRDRSIYQVRLCSAGPLMKRQGNHGGFRAGAHNREPTPPKAPTDR